jgi:hypothetical protein
MWEERGVKPPALANRPVLLDIWVWPHSVWQELSGSRPSTEHSLPLISFSEVAIYGMVHGCSNLEVADLWDDLHRIDKAWRNEVIKIRESQA